MLRCGEDDYISDLTFSKARTAFPSFLAFLPTTMTTSTEISAGTPLPAHRISASPDGSTLAIASGAHIAVLSAASGALLSSIDITAPSADGPSTPLVRLIAISPDGKHLAATGDDKVIRVWKMPALEGGSLVVEKAMPKRASCLLWERDATAVLVADKFGDLRV